MQDTMPRAPGPQGQESADAQRPVEPPADALDLRVAKLSDVGRARPHNEDYVDFYVPPDPRQLSRKGAIYLVADGMGGHQAGEVASRGAVELTIGEYYSDTTRDIGTSLVRAVRIANQQIYEQAQADPSKGGMGTTLVAAVILGRKVYVANVGDSRAYLVNSKGITQITEDHSWVEEQVRAGLLTDEQARRHPQRNLVTRALGSKPDVQVDLFEGELNAGDTLLLCSDGLTGRVEDHEIATIVREQPPQEATRLLVGLANERGGNDNITVLIVSAREEAATVKAPVVAPVKKKPARRSLLVPVLGGLAAVLVLALGVLLGMGVIPSLFEGTPTFTPMPADTPTGSPSVVVPTDTATPEVQATLTGEVLLTPTATLSSTVGVTPETPTATLEPTFTPTPEPTATLELPTPTASATNTPEPTYPAPSPREPAADVELFGNTTFRWDFSPALAPGDAFEVLIWKEGDSVHNGAESATPERQQIIDLEQVPRIQQGGVGDYFWSVVVVRGVERVSPEAEPRRFKYIGPPQPAAKPTTQPSEKPTPSGGVTPGGS